MNKVIQKLGNFDKYHEGNMVINWKFTKICNYTCSYSGSYDNSAKFQSVENLLHAIQQIKQLKKSHYTITLTGGEPTIHPSFLFFLETLITELSNKVNIIIITNLSWKKKFLTEFVEKFSCHNQQISLVSSFHSEFAKKEEFLEKVAYLTKLKFRVSINLMANPNEMKLVQSIKSRLDNIKNAYLKYNPIAIRTANGFHQNYTTQDLEWIKSGINEENKNVNVVSSKEGNTIQNEYYSPVEINTFRLNNFRGMLCEAGINNFSIDYDGDVQRAVCFRGLKSSFNIFKNTNLENFLLDKPFICPYERCSCTDDIPIPKYKVVNAEKSKKATLEYIKKDIEPLTNQLINTPKEGELIQNIEQYFSLLYGDKEMLYNFAQFFKEKSQVKLYQKVLNIYFGYKAAEFKKKVKLTSSNILQEEYKSLYKIFEESTAKDVFQHYIFTHMLLNNIDIQPDNQNKVTLNKYLNPINWSYKSLLYESSIEEIIKVDHTHTNSSIIIISNNKEKDILDTLREIHLQKDFHDYKIIFVSNNHINKTKEVLEYVDTFIQMKTNNGAYLARNVGSIFAFCNLLIFMEDDGIPEKDFVKTHENIHMENDVVAVRGVYLSKTNGIMPHHYWLGPKQKPASTSLEGNCSFNAQKFYSVGGWGDYIMFGHGGHEISHRLLQNITLINQHVYSPLPILYHDYSYAGKDLEKKLLVQHASWQTLKFSYKDFHLITNKWS